MSREQNIKLVREFNIASSSTTLEQLDALWISVPAALHPKWNSCKSCATTRHKYVAIGFYLRFFGPNNPKSRLKKLINVKSRKICNDQSTGSSSKDQKHQTRHDKPTTVSVSTHTTNALYFVLPVEHGAHSTAKRHPWRKSIENWKSVNKIQQFCPLKHRIMNAGNCTRFWTAVNCSHLLILCGHLWFEQI